MTNAHEKDEFFMRQALELAKTNLGKTSPSPSVGCVIVKDGVVVGSGVTDIGGRPHAEFQAITMAGDLAIGAEIYVTLEPCAHESHRGPACSNILLEIKPKRVIIAHLDPDPRTSGKGLTRLLANEIQTKIGILEDDARQVNAGFINWILHKKPIIGISENGESYDAPFEIRQGEDFETALLRHGEMGHTRVWVSPTSPINSLI